MRLHTTTIFLVSLALPLATTAIGQSDKGTIQGTVSDPVGAILANAPVQAKNAATGMVFKATSTAKGSYAIADLPAGKYDVSVNIGGLKPFRTEERGCDGG